MTGRKIQDFAQKINFWFSIFYSNLDIEDSEFAITLAKNGLKIEK